MPLLGHEYAFIEPPKTLECTPWAPMPGPHGHPNSWTIIHDFSSFRAIFPLLRARQVFSSRTSIASPGSLKIPRAPQTIISFPLLPSLGSLGTTLGRPTRASNRHYMALPRHECAFREPPMTLGFTPWAPVPEPHGRPNSWTIIHDFSSLRAVFRFSRPDKFYRPGPP